MQMEGDGAVTVVGDVINNAPALHEAKCSIAMGNGLDITREVVDVVYFFTLVVYIVYLKLP